MKNIIFYKLFKIFIIIILSSLFSCDESIKLNEVYKTKNLKINQLSEHAYIHESYLDTEAYGKVPCNGMVFIDELEALVFDTPTTNKTSQELIDWLKNDMNCKVRSVIVTHFHVDAMGGLEAFHKNEITSFANSFTIDIAKEKELVVPEYGITSSYEHQFGNSKVISLFVGEGHSKDNIVGYFSNEGILFGGCLVKALGAKKGNLEDANTVEWPKTIEKLSVMVPKVQIVVPGHGEPGSATLLKYTIELFE
ncbi:subclass B1 metallo-beta-lactamase [Lutimonas halocynthiae]|uniref:subclass B1 metallo-beta-lactamase n=1 Tax=Lutimonas halocynthiae TaxID=1446477 RepID=UPI0025B2864B|nr:subclass B1 metallo-beta-lactamase [Lutimonas halocynthiae]MDN3643333.1 subclass B1 metallo-beta-lactamase [Lutimonas halocynthiae]